MSLQFQNRFMLTQGKDFSSLLELTGVPHAAGGPKEPTRVKPERYLSLLTHLKVSPWGDNNTLPQEIRDDIRKSAVLKRALKFRIDAHYGKGPKIFTERVEADKLIYEPLQHAEISAFMRRNWVEKVQMRLISDWEFFRNIFPVIILSNDRSKITTIYAQNAMHCRWGYMNDRGIVDTAFIGDWTNGKIEEHMVDQIPVLDPFQPIADLRSRKSGYKFILPIKAEEFDNLYYDETFWDPIRKSWLPIACAVPAIRSAIMKNQMMIKYHIKVPYAWLEKKKQDLQLDSSEKMDEFLAEFLKKMDDYLTDTKNAGKAFISYYGKDPVNIAQEIQEWKIEALDNKLKHDDHLPDSVAANSEILTGVGVDPTLIGGQLPGGGEAGSGSNKREAYWIHQALTPSDRMYTARWYDYVAEYNGWPQDSCMRYLNIETAQTLDKNPTGAKTTL